MLWWSEYLWMHPMSQMSVTTLKRFLQPNTDKTEVPFIVPESMSEKAQQCFGPYAANFKQALGNLRAEMNLELHRKKMVQSCFLQLKKKAKIKTVLLFQDLERKLFMFLSSPDLNHCNSLFTTLVQNAAASLLTNTWRRSHISPVLARLHWLSKEL